MKKIIKFSLLSLFILFSLSSCVSSKNETPQKSVTEKSSNSAYEKATKDLVGEKISKETYEQDKAIVLQKIKELNVIMKDKNYKAWLSYVEKDSINFWSLRKNLVAASKQSALKGLQLKNLEDYFKYIFIPARHGRKIDDIRYISSTSIKAIQYKNDDSGVVVFYYFTKENGEWLIHLPKDF